MNAVPFELKSVHGGFAQCHGLLRDEGSHISLEFQVKDALFGVVKGSVRNVKIPLADLSAVSIERRWFGWSNLIVIQAKSLAAVQKVPCMLQGKVELSIAGKDLPAARTLVDGLHVADGDGDELTQRS